MIVPTKCTLHNGLPSIIAQSTHTHTHTSSLVLSALTAFALRGSLSTAQNDLLPVFALLERFGFL